MSESPQNETVQRQIDDPEVQAKLQKVREKLGLTAPTAEGTPSVEVTAEPEIEEVIAPESEVVKEAKMDWSQFDLDPQIAHLYPRSVVRPTPEGPRFVAMIEITEFETGSYKKLGDIVSDRLNGPEGWKIGYIGGNGSGMGAVMFVRQAPVVLPQPRLLKDVADMPSQPADEELVKVEDVAEQWIEAEGQQVRSEDQIVDFDPNVFAAQAAEEAADALAGPDFGEIPDSVIEGTNIPHVAPEGEEAGQNG